jgi:hypothetical protein
VFVVAVEAVVAVLHERKHQLFLDIHYQKLQNKNNTTQYTKYPWRWAFDYTHQSESDILNLVENTFKRIKVSPRPFSPCQEIDYYRRGN